jgi:type IV secretory pathway VirJ component
MPRVCIFGDRDPHDACRSFARDQIRPIRLAGSHHFDGDYAPVSAAILKSAGL